MHKPLEDDVALKRCQDLVDIIRLLVDLCSQLYAQNVRIRVLASEDDFKEFGETRFSVASKLVSAHASLRIHEKDDTSRDGSPIDLVVQPAIIAYNDKRPETDSEYSVWLKAIVWMKDNARQNTRGHPKAACQRQFRGEKLVRIGRERKPRRTRSIVILMTRTPRQRVNLTPPNLTVCWST
jgi:hypothetical protein